MERIKIETIVHADIEKVWKHWNDPESIKGWAFASDDWECPYAENDLRVGGRFLTRMAAKDKSAAFDFAGTYTEVIDQKSITYLMDKEEGAAVNRDCTITFTDRGDYTTKIEEEFLAEGENSIEMQKAGWFAILENFNKFVTQQR